jgi:hypothetical protein
MADLAGWLDAQRSQPAELSGAAATHNRTEHVGTGAALQVLSLRRVRFRASLMHHGCAETRSEHFSNVAHGTTSEQRAAQVSDLTAYLEPL